MTARVFTMIGIWTVIASPAVAQEPVSPYIGDLTERSVLTGDWLGARSALAENGITIDSSVTQFYQGVADGGLEQLFKYGGRSDIYLHIDGQKAGLWQGLFVDLHDETLYGQSVNSFVGSLLPVSIGQSIPVANGPVNALTGVKITQALSESFVVYGGKINTLDGFIQQYAAGRGVDTFMNTSFVFNPVLARTIPYSTYGFGAAVLKDLYPVFTFNVFDPNNTPTTSGFNTFFEGGAVIYSALSIPTQFFDRPGHYGVAGSYSSKEYTALDNLPYLLISRLRPELPPAARETGSWSITGQFDQAFWVDEANPKRSWGMFGNAGISDGNPNPIRWAANIGLGGSVPIASRPLDTFGVGYFYVGLSDYLKNLAPRRVPLGDEQGVELFYNAAVTPWCHISPDLQIVLPGRERADTSILFGLRAKLNF